MPPELLGVAGVTSPPPPLTDTLGPAAVTVVSPPCCPPAVEDEGPFTGWEVEDGVRYVEVLLGTAVRVGLGGRLCAVLEGGMMTPEREGGV